MGADVSVSLELEAQRCYEDLQRVQNNLASFASKTAQHGDEAAKNFSKGFKGGFSDVFGSLKGAFSGVLGGLGIGIGIGAVVNKFEQVIEKGSRIHDIAAKFHVDAEQLQLIGNAAEQDGVSLEKVAGALNLLTINGAKAANAGSPLNESAERLHINAQAFAKSNAVERYFMLADAWRKSSQSAQDYADAASLVGKKNTDVLVAMDRTREEIEKISREAGILSTSSVNSLDKTGDAFTKFNSRVTTNIGESIGWLDKFNAKMETVGDKVGDFLQKHGLSRSIFGAGDGKSDLETGGGKFGGVGAGSDFGGGTNVAPKESGDVATRVEGDEYQTTAKKDKAEAIVANELDVIGADKEAKAETEHERKEAVKEDSQQQKEAVNKNFEKRERAREGRKDELNPTGLSLHDFASKGVGVAGAKAREAESEEALAKQLALHGNTGLAAQHQNRAEQLKKDLGLDNKIDRAEAFKDGLDKSELLKKIEKNTAEAGANK